jgi:signal transduction histidine kinase
LRTPLTTIIGAVEVLQAGAKDDAAQRDRFLAHIEREAARLARLARALLTLARANAGQEKPRVEAVSVAALLQDVADELRPRDGVVVDVDCPPELLATVNRDLLEQALRNLGENAAKYTPSGRIVLRGSAAGNSVSVEVEDTGVGISRDAQLGVFDRFYRGQDRDPEGFGLGLAIVRQAVQSLGAELGLESVPGRGTRVTIELAHARVRDEVPA